MPYARKKRYVRRTVRPRRRPRFTRRRRMYRTAAKKFSGSSMRNTVMPLKYKFSTRYVETQGTLNSPPGTLAQYMYSANGLYDPDISGTGHQPIGFDQMMQFYNHYTVIACKIKVMIYNDSDSNDVIVALDLNDNTPSAPNMSTLIENGSVKWRRLARQGNDGSQIQNPRSSCVLSKGVSIRKYFSRKVMSSDQLRGNAGSNPNDQVYFKIYVGNAMGSADAVSIRFTVQLDYIAILSEPKDIVSS